MTPAPPLIVDTEFSLPWRRAKPRMLARILAPLAAAAFVAKHWGRSVVIARSPRGRRWLERSCSRDRLEQRLSEGVFPSSSITITGSNGVPASPAHVAQLSQRSLAPGAILVVRDLEQHDDELRGLCVELSRELNAIVRAQARWIVPGKTTAQTAADAFGSFVVQTEGNARIAIAVRGARKARTLKLSRGDCVYLPAGTEHSVRAGTEPALQLVLTAHALGTKEVLACLGDHALLRCSEDILFRRSCSARADRWIPNDRAYLEECLRRFAAAFRMDEVDDLVEDLFLRRAYADSEQRYSRGQLFVDLGPTTRLVRNSVLFFARRDDEHLVLKVARRKILFPKRIAEAFDFVVKRRRFSVKEIPALDDDGRILLAQTLVREGFLSVEFA